MSLNTNPKNALLIFVEHLEVERNVSKLTIRNYSHYLRKFIEWFEQQGHTDLKELDQDGIRSYRVHLSRTVNDLGQSLGKRTQSYYIIALRSFLKFVVKNDLPVLHPEKIDLPKADARQMQFLTISRVERLLSQPLLS